MNKTKIPWCDYTINPVKGLCPMACEYCYARRMYKRFKWNPSIRFEPETLIDLSVVPKGSKVFIGSTIELFHEYTEQWMPYILDCVQRAPWQTSIFLTKQPQNLVGYSFPSNAWVGITVCDDKMANGIVSFEGIDATVKFVSYEPMLEDAHLHYYTDFFNWCILGSRTQPTKHPPLDLVERTISAMNKAHIPVFIKEPLASYINIQRQEFPEPVSDIELLTK